MPPSDLRQAPMVLLDDSRPAHRAGRSLLFHSPETIITAQSLADLPDALSAMDQAVANGLHLAGWIGYECAAHFEPRLKSVIKTMPKEPLLWMMATRHRTVMDHAQVGEALFDARRGVHHMARLTLGVSPVSEKAYLKALANVHEYIRAGDVYQINYTFPIPCQLEGDALALYERLRASQPVPFGAYIDTGPTASGDNFQILSLSPELFVRRQQDRLTARPMKGTAPRGMTHDEDLAIADALKADPKSQAENLMIVDLIRNDLSRISEPGSVTVNSLFETEKYPTLYQMTSTIDAAPRSDLPPSALLAALFPCGSVTGAPKVRALEIIAELENAPRGIYCGAIGHFSPTDKTKQTGGDWSLNVPIRTMVLDGSGKGRLHVGSGVVADSVAAGEYQECLLKARFAQRDPRQFSLIETMRLDEDGTIQLLDRHLDRLASSAHYFDFPYDRQHVHSMLVEHIEALRPLEGARRLRLLMNETGAATIASSVLHEPSSSDQPLRVCLARETARSDNSFLYHKTTNRTLYDGAYARAHKAGFADILFFNERGELTEGAISNVFIVKGGQWITPPVSAGLLAGTFRSELIAAQQPAIHQQAIRREDLTTADEIFIANSVRGLRKVSLSTDIL